MPVSLHVQLFTGHFSTFSVSESWTKEPHPGPTDSSRFLLGPSAATSIPDISRSVIAIDEREGNEETVTKGLQHAATMPTS